MFNSTCTSCQLEATNINVVSHVYCYNLLWTAQLLHTEMNMVVRLGKEAASLTGASKDRQSQESTDGGVVRGAQSGFEASLSLKLFHHHLTL